MPPVTTPSSFYRVERREERGERREERPEMIRRDEVEVEKSQQCRHRQPERHSSTKTGLTGALRTHLYTI